MVFFTAKFLKLSNGSTHFQLEVSAVLVIRDVKFSFSSIHDNLYIDVMDKVNGVTYREKDASECL